MTLPIKDGRLHPLPDWLTAPSARAVIAALEAVGGEGCARFVGGCVRDTLLRRAEQVSDVDIATKLTPERTIAALEAAGLRAIPTGVEHGTVTALSGSRSYEITTLRRDVETDGRRAVVAFTDDWAEDAARRDFRLNALYADPDGTLHDPTGGGLADVEARRIVFVGDPETRIREDYLRILRFFRFLARVGDAAEADPAGLAACAKLKDGIAGLSGERVREEMFKLLGSAWPWPALVLMDEVGVLAAAVPGSSLGRVGGLLVLQQEHGIESDVVLRLSAILPADRGIRGRVAKRLRLSVAAAARLLGVLYDPDVRISPELPAKSRRRARYLLGPLTYRDRLLTVWIEDGMGLGDPRWRDHLKWVEWSPPPFPLTGEDIMALGVPKGPQVGAVRKAVERWWIDGDFQAGKAGALAFARSVVEQA
ncbi:CCA tRNA nucleotidyltransferase [soil metagenome]